MELGVNGCTSDTGYEHDDILRLRQPISVFANSPKRVSSIAISPWSHGLISSRSVSIQAFRSNRWFVRN